MEKAFDLKVLEARLKEQGLPEVEGLAEKVAAVTFGWSKESVQLLDNALLKAIAAPAISALEVVALQQIDKIDGQPG